MADELIFYTNPMSRGRIARWMLEETGVPYTTQVLTFDGTIKAPEYLAVNPMGKVPAIRHGRTVVTECAAICAYLAETFPDAGLAPRPEERGSYCRWMFFTAGPLEAAVTNRALGFQTPPDKSRMVGYGSYADVMNTLERAVSHPLSPAIDSQPLTSMSVPTSAGAWASAPSRSARPSRIISAASPTAPATSVRPQSMTRP
jgi:glutathione S-transferase